VNEWEEVQQKSEEFLRSAQDFDKISKIIQYKASLFFKTSKQALDNISSVVARTLTEDLTEFLKLNLKTKKKGSSKSFTLGLEDKKFSNIINETLGIGCTVGEFVIEIIRVIRTHITKYLKIKPEDLIKSQLGLGHSYSRMKCMFDVNREDKPIIQSIALIDQLDKNINSFIMRIKEWFSWHFPELARIVSDNHIYVKIVNLIEKKDNLIENNDLLAQVEELCVDPELAKQIYDASKTSMGSDLPEADLQNIKYFCDNVMNLIKYREELLLYLREKMKKLAPNVAALVGETVAARLISHAGSLSNLSKFPASTIQILGAEKALFRALKTRGKTPKYGLLYHSSFIGKANAQNKGKVSRYLANKLAMCSRIDFFSEERVDDYGVELKNQIEERLKFLASGQKPRKNIDVMKQVYEKLKNKEMEANGELNGENGNLLKKKKKKAAEENVEAVVEKKSKRKKAEPMLIKEEEQVEDEEEVVEKPKKKKKTAK
jgi:nucleolar protein 56